MFSVDIAVELADLLPALGDTTAAVHLLPSGWLVALEVDGKLRTNL